MLPHPHPSIDFWKKKNSGFYLTLYQTLLDTVGTETFAVELMK